MFYTKYLKHSVLVHMLLISNSIYSYKNGSLTREKIRDDISLSAISEKWPQVEIKESGNNHDIKPTWDVFNQLLGSTPRGNFGNIGMYDRIVQSLIC